MKSPADIRLQPLLREREWHWEEIPALKLTLSLPHCASEDRRIRRINRYYESFARSAEQYALRFLFPAAPSRISIEPDTYSSAVYSSIFDVSPVLGGVGGFVSSG